MMTAQERKDFRRVQKSRDIWKKRAVRRGEDRRRIGQRRQEVDRSRNGWFWDTDPNAYQVPTANFLPGTRPRTCSAYNQLGRLGVVVRFSDGRVWDHFRMNGAWGWTRITP